MDTYYVNLNSASCTDLFPGNTNTNFRVQLPNPIVTRGSRCALSEIAFSSDILNLPPDNFISLGNQSTVKDKVEIDITANQGLGAKIKDAFKPYGLLEYKDDRYMLTLPKNITFKCTDKITRIIGKVDESYSKGTHKIISFTPRREIFTMTNAELYTRLHTTPDMNLAVRFNEDGYKFIIDKGRTLEEVLGDFNIKFASVYNFRFKPLTLILSVNISEDLMKALGFKFSDDGKYVIDYNFTNSESITFLEAEVMVAKYSMPSINYNAEKQAFMIFRELLKEKKDICEPSINSDSARVKLIIRPNGLVKMSESLSLFLGFGGVTEFTSSTEAKTGICLNYRSNTLFVHCSIVSHSVVSNVYSKILRVIPLERRDSSSMIYKSFIDPQFFRVDRDTVENVHVSLRTELGEYLHLNDSSISTWVTLAFQNGYH